VAFPTVKPTFQECKQVLDYLLSATPRFHIDGKHVALEFSTPQGVSRKPRQAPNNQGSSNTAISAAVQVAEAAIQAANWSKGAQVSVVVVKSKIFSPNTRSFLCFVPQHSFISMFCPQQFFRFYTEQVWFVKTMLVWRGKHRAISHKFFIFNIFCLFVLSSQSKEPETNSEFFSHLKTSLEPLIIRSVRFDIRHCRQDSFCV